MSQERTARSTRKLDPARIEAEVIELCREHIDPLSRYAAGLTQKDSLIQEALQEAFLRYFIVKTDGRNIENPRMWLTCVLKNYIAENDLRSGATTDPEFGNEPGNQPPDANTMIDQKVAFRRSLASLSRREHECLRLHVEGYMYNEIAQIMHMRKRAVGALLCDVLDHFRKDRRITLPRRIFSEGRMDTHYVIAHLRLVWAEAQYQKRVHRRVYLYLGILGLLTTAAAVAAALIK